MVEVQLSVRDVGHLLAELDNCVQTLGDCFINIAVLFTVQQLQIAHILKFPLL